MSSTPRDDMRALLKTFGIQADEAVIAHLVRNPGLTRLKVRLSLQDLTEYGGSTPKGKLSFAIEGDIGRES